MRSLLHSFYQRLLFYSFLSILFFLFFSFYFILFYYVHSSDDHRSNFHRKKSNIEISDALFYAKNAAKQSPYNVRSVINNFLIDFHTNHSSFKMTLISTFYMKAYWLCSVHDYYFHKNLSVIFFIFSSFIFQYEYHFN